MVKDIDDKEWLSEMMSLARQEVRKPRSDHCQLTHDERVIRDFIDGTEIFAED